MRTPRRLPLLGWVVVLAMLSTACTSPAGGGVTAGSAATNVTAAAAQATGGSATSIALQRSPAISPPLPLSPNSPAVTTSTSRQTTLRTSPAGSTCIGNRCYTVGPVQRLPAGVAPESSGIAASSRRPGVYFVVDDGTGNDQIVAVDSSGAPVGIIDVRDMSTDNAEALAAGPCGSRAGRCLYVGDIGDNGAQRNHISIYRIDEPSLTPVPRNPVPSDRWDYAYPDGPHNAEAMMVAEDGSLVVITKSAPGRTTGIVPPHRVYRAAPGGGELTYVSSFTPPAPARRLQSLLTGTVVTDAAYSAGRVLLLTYDQVVEYVAPTAGAALSSFPSWPHHELPDPVMIQSEGITWQTNGCGYETTSEEGPDGTQAALAGVACR